MSLIHTIGDSHCQYGWEHKRIVKHHLGPILCYSFGNDTLNRCDLRTCGIRNGDVVIFCFGEIDCRCHVGKHVSDTRTYQEIIDELIGAYIKAIALSVSMLSIRLKRIGVYNVVPPIQKEGIYHNPEFPFIGTDQERIRYVLYFNERLKQSCHERGYLFVDVYDAYRDEQGFLKKELSDGNVHIKDGVYLNEFIKAHRL